MTTKPFRRAVAAVVAIAVVAVLVVTTTTADAANGKIVRARGELTLYSNPYGDGTPNPISPGATAKVKAQRTKDGGTIVTLKVKGLPPNREFGAHAHVLACNDNKAGGHYQNVPAPPGGNSSAYANPENEVWLDFTTNEHGHGKARAEVEWTFRIDGANAVIIHDHHTTDTDPGAGTAGAKLACLDVDF